jgi:hypothetical protein
MVNKKAPIVRQRRVKEPKLFDGERHGVLWVKGKGFQRANYMGPGTDIFKRIARGDNGKTPIDEISKLHDIDYTIASGMASTDQEHASMGRDADNRMITNGWKAYKSGKENLFNLVEGAGLIKAKTLLEDWGILSKTRFLSARTFKYSVGAEKRDASEYEILLRARHGLVCGEGVTGDKGECQKTQGELSTI